jgi:hypothetical protein
MIDLSLNGFVKFFQLGRDAPAHLLEISSDTANTTRNCLCTITSEEVAQEGVEFSSLSTLTQL